MKKIIFALALILTFTLLIVGAYAAEEASVIVRINYYANFGQGDITDDIFVGDQENPFGSGEVEIPLMENGEIITDDQNSDRSNGLQILRGVDEIGAFVDIISHGPNDEDSRESIKFITIFQNTKIEEINSGGNGHGRFEKPSDGECGIAENERQNARNDNPANDEIEQRSDRRAKFCSVTSNNPDSVRIYLDLEDDRRGDLEITNVRTEPSLPLINDGDSQNIHVFFDSNRYPVDVKFILTDSDGVIVDSTSSIIVNDQTELPVIYTLSSELAEGDYELEMEVSDEFGNVAEIVLGSITVEQDSDSNDDNGGNGGKDNKKKHGLRIIESIKLEPGKKQAFNPLFLEEDGILLQNSENGKYLWLWVLIIALLIILLVAFIAIAAAR